MSKNSQVLGVIARCSLAWRCPGPHNDTVDNAMRSHRERLAFPHA